MRRCKVKQRAHNLPLILISVDVPFAQAAPILLSSSAGPEDRPYRLSLDDRFDSMLHRRTGPRWLFGFSKDQWLAKAPDTANQVGTSGSLGSPASSGQAIAALLKDDAPLLSTSDLLSSPQKPQFVHIQDSVFADVFTAAPLSGDAMDVTSSSSAFRVPTEPRGTVPTTDDRNKHLSYPLCRPITLPCGSLQTLGSRISDVSTTSVESKDSLPLACQQTHRSEATLGASQSRREYLSGSRLQRQRQQDSCWVAMLLARGQKALPVQSRETSIMRIDADGITLEAAPVPRPSPMAAPPAKVPFLSSEPGLPVISSLSWLTLLLLRPA